RGRRRGSVARRPADPGRPGAGSRVRPGDVGPGRGRRLDGGRRRLARPARRCGMKVLVVDVGGTHVKILATGEPEHRQVDSGPAMTARAMVTAVKRLSADWSYDRVTVGFPGPVVHGHVFAEPHNLGRGWVGFDFRRAFGRPVKLVNDAAMQ